MVTEPLEVVTTTFHVMLLAPSENLIVHEVFEPEDASQLLARRTGAVVVKLAPSVFGVPAARGYAELFDYNVGTLARALSAASN